MSQEKLYSPEEVAQRLSIAPRTVRAWLRSGKIQGVKMGRLWRISEGILSDHCPELKVSLIEERAKEFIDNIFFAQRVEDDTEAVNKQHYSDRDSELKKELVRKISLLEDAEVKYFYEVITLYIMMKQQKQTKD
jgi:excisionase family DNA binding protein